MDLWGGRVDLKMPSQSIDVRSLLKIPEHIKVDTYNGNKDLPQHVSICFIILFSSLLSFV